MRTPRLTPVLVLSLAAAAFSCKDPVSRPFANQPPRTYFWLFPDSTLNEGNSKQSVHWWGEDPDGIVLGFLFTSGKFPLGASASQLSDTLVWRWTTQSDTLVAFPLSKQRDTFGIAIRAVDNTFPVRLPEGAAVRLGASPYWDVNEDSAYGAGDISLISLAGAIDPDGAVQRMPILNQRPAVTFARDPNDPTRLMQQPETTFTAATFSWIGTDPDGDQTIRRFEVALNDTSDTLKYFLVPGEFKTISIVVPRSRSNGATGSVDADVYSGQTYATRRPILGALQGLVLDSLNTFYVRARDVAGDVSPFITMPDTGRGWFVKKPRGKLLVVADLTSGVYGDRVGVMNIYRSVLGRVLGGRFSDLEVLDIARGLSADDKLASKVGPMVPPFYDPALLFTLHLFDIVVWYTDPVPSLTVAQSPLNEYVQHGGRVIYSTMFATLLDPRRALRDFAPVDSVSAVDLESAQYPKSGDKQIPGAFFVLPDSENAAYPALQFNYPVFRHSLYMRPVFKRTDATYLYDMQEDTRLPIRYVYTATQNELRSASAVGDKAWICGYAGTIAATRDGGEHWELQKSGTTNDLQQVRFSSPLNGWIAGSSGTVLKTEDGGATWIRKLRNVSQHLYGVSFSTSELGLLVGSQGIIIRTTDGGAHWNDVSLRDTSKRLFSVDFSDDSTAAAVGDSGYILKTRNGGTTWKAVPRVTARRLNAVRFVNASTGWAVGANGINLRTLDSGSTWSTMPIFSPFELRSIWFSDENTGWITGLNGTIYKTVNGGATWTPLGSGVGQHLDGVAFGGASRGWAAGTSGLIIQSDDGGTTWSARPRGPLRVGVINRQRTFVFMGLPLHLLNGDETEGGSTLQPFFEYVLTHEFGE